MVGQNTRQTIIKVTSWWVRWRFKSPVSRVFVQPFVQAQIKKISKLRVTGLSEGNPTVTGRFPTKRTSNAENVSIWWCHHDMIQVHRRTWCMLSQDQENCIWMFVYTYTYTGTLKNLHALVEDRMQLIIGHYYLIDMNICNTNPTLYWMEILGENDTVDNP